MVGRNLVGLVYNSQVPGAVDLVNGLVHSLGLRSRSWVSPALQVTNLKDKLEKTSIVVTVGGDGTILRTVRVVAPLGLPIVGINMGRVGFMTELSVQEAPEKLRQYLDGGLRVEERMMLQASVTPRSQGTARLMLHALNDIVVGRGSVARLLDIDAAVDGVPLTSYRADAVIVATATGSTGYALSAGGPILYPEARLMLVQPVAAHAGLQHGLVLPEGSIVELTARDAQPAMLSADGFQDTALEAQEKVVVQRSPYVARFLRSHGPSSFYADLTRRLELVYRSPPRAPA